MGTVNWNEVFRVVGKPFMASFSSGQLSGRELTSYVAFTPVAGEIRKLLRNRGVQGARQLARKALSRQPV